MFWARLFTILGQEQSRPGQEGRRVPLPLKGRSGGPGSSAPGSQRPREGGLLLLHV